MSPFFNARGSVDTALKADNRQLTDGAKYTYTLTNYASGVSTVSVVNPSGISVDSYLLFGIFGSESAEILKVATVNAGTGALTFKDDMGNPVNTAFAHPESTKVTILPYNMVIFYWTATSTFDSLNPVTGFLAISPSDWYTTTPDATHTTGYGWFKFYNATTAAYSSASNPIPYGGFVNSVVKATIESFFSMLNQKELRLISLDDAFLWLNEGYSRIRNELNLVNLEYFASDVQSITIVAGQSEYLLPTNFGDMLIVYDSNISPTYEIGFIYLTDIPGYSDQDPKYYLRGPYIGFAPSPTVGGTTYKYRYISKSTDVSSYNDTIDLPDNAHFAIKDWMLFRAHMKLGNPQVAQAEKQIFDDWVGKQKIWSIKRQGGQDSWTIRRSANV